MGARGDRSVAAMMKALLGQTIGLVAAHCLAEFYRGGAKTAREAQLLRAWRVEVVPVGANDGKLAGELLAASGGANSMDALVVAVASRHYVTKILTSDPDDLARLRNALPAAAHRDFAVIDIR